MARVAVYGRTDEPAVVAVGEGFAALGCTVIYQRPSVWASGEVPRVDLAVVHGLRLHNGRLAEHFRGEGVPVYVLDLPPLRISGYFALWRDHVNNLPGECPEDRLGMVPTWRKPALGSRVLVCGQCRGDAAHGMGPEDLQSYYRRAVTSIIRRKITGAREIIWRPHPQWIIAAPVDGIGYSDPQRVSLERELRHPDLGALVSYNSTCGVLALAAGIPTFCDASAFYASAADTGLPNRTNPRPDPAEVRQLMARLSYVQWSLEELASGYPQRLALAQAKEAA